MAAKQPPPLMKKHSQTDLVSRLKTRKILGVGGEDDDGEVHRSKVGPGPSTGRAQGSTSTPSWEAGSACLASGRRAAWPVSLQEPQDLAHFFFSRNLMEMSGE